MNGLKKADYLTPVSDLGPSRKALGEANCRAFDVLSKIEDLTFRLEPVLRAIPPQAIPTEETASPPRSCTLECEAVSVYEYADNAVRRLQDLLDRLAL